MSHLWLNTEGLTVSELFWDLISISQSLIKRLKMFTPKN